MEKIGVYWVLFGFIGFYSFLCEDLIIGLSDVVNSALFRIDLARKSSIFVMAVLYSITSVK